MGSSRIRKIFAISFTLNLYITVWQHFLLVPKATCYAGRMWKLFALMFLAMSMIPAADTAGKLLSQSHGVSPAFVAWSRFLIGGLVAVVLVRRDTVRLMRDWRTWFRAGLMTCGILSIQTALRSAPLADVFAAFFIAPIVSYVLSVAFLGETVSKTRSALMALGFCGVLLVVRPGMDMSPGLAFAALAGVCYGTYLTTSRWMAPVARPGSLLFTQLFLGTLFLTPFCWPLVPEMTATVTGLTLASALFSLVGNFLLLFAYARAEAATLAPLVYLQLASAVTLGWYVFGDLPDVTTWAGLSLIVAAGLASAMMSRPKNAAPNQSAAQPTGS